MSATLILTLALAVQAPAPAAGDKPEPQAPKATAAPANDLRSTIQSTLAKKKAIQAKKSANRAAQRAQDAARAKAQAEYELKMAPIVAAQQRDAARLAIEAQQAQALQAIGQAAAQNAMTNQQRYRLQTQQAGVPQIFVPGQGYMPYPGAVAGPQPPAVFILEP